MSHLKNTTNWSPTDQWIQPNGTVFPNGYSNYSTGYYATIDTDAQHNKYIAEFLKDLLKAKAKGIITEDQIIRLLEMVTSLDKEAINLADKLKETLIKDEGKGP